MDMLTILFAGLIAHVMTDSGAQRAVLVAAPEHEARLIVDAADVIENRGFERDARGAFMLDGEHVVIDGIPKGEATFAASYVRHVPSLMRISDATGVIPEIQTATPNEAVTAYVDLGRGTFSAEEVYRDQATFGRGRSECIASTVAFRVPAAAEIVFRTDTGKALRVRGSATVRILNDPPRGAGGGDHFHMYARILANVTHIDSPVPTGMSCGTRRRVAAHEVRSDVDGVRCPNTGCCP